MSRKEEDQKERYSFFKDLIKRRVFQIIGIYIAAGWGIIQFVEWLVNRYVLSPHLTDLTAIILLSLLPSTLIVAYFHGRPGRDKWTPVEKIGIPVNLIFTLLIIFVFSSSNDLGAAQKTITLKDESGKKIEKVIPKQQFRKKLALFFFDNISGNKNNDWLQSAVPHFLMLDLSQDLFIETKSTITQDLMTLDFIYYEKMKEAGYADGVNLPLPFKQKLAQDMHMDYFVSGSIDKTSSTCSLKCNLYKTKNANLVASNSFTSKDIFKLVDQVSKKLKEDLEIPNRHIKEVSDLPISEITTKSIQAARLFFKAHRIFVFEKDWSKGEKLLKKAIQNDPTFALAYQALSGVYVMTNQLDKLKQCIAPLMKHLYKLPDREQLYAKITYYYSKEDNDSQVSILKMIIQLYPQDMMARKILANFYAVTSRPDQAIDMYQQMLTIDPSRYQINKFLGNQYKAKGDLVQARTYYQKFAEAFPKSSESFVLLGQIELESGNFNAALSHYKRGLVIDPTDVSLLLNVAWCHFKLGMLEKAEKNFQDALDLSKSFQDKAKVYLNLNEYYGYLGQMEKALEYKIKHLNTVTKFAPPIQIILNKMAMVSDYINAGDEKRAWQELNQLKKTTGPPLDKALIIGDLMIYSAQKNHEKLQELMPQLKQLEGFIGKVQLKTTLNQTLGKIAEIKGDYATALTHYQKQLTMATSSRSVFEKIGRCYAALNQYDKANEYLLKIHLKDPFAPDINFKLASIYKKMGEDEKARDHLQRAVKVWQNADPHYMPAQEAKKMLSEWHN